MSEKTSIRFFNNKPVRSRYDVGTSSWLMSAVDLIAAIVDCGDITDHGSREIQVTRGNQTQTYDYFSAKDRAIKLRPNDVIFVKLRGPFEGRPSKIGP